MYDRKRERERDNRCELDQPYRVHVWKKFPTFENNTTSEDKTRQENEEYEHDFGGKTLARERERERRGTYKCLQESYYCSSALLRPPLDAAGCSIHVQIHIYINNIVEE